MRDVGDRNQLLRLKTGSFQNAESPTCSLRRAVEEADNNFVLLSEIWIQLRKLHSLLRSPASNTRLPKSLPSRPPEDETANRSSRLAARLKLCFASTHPPLSGQTERRETDRLLSVTAGRQLNASVSLLQTQRCFSLFRLPRLYRRLCFRVSRSLPISPSTNANETDTSPTPTAAFRPNHSLVRPCSPSSEAFR